MSADGAPTDGAPTDAVSDDGGPLVDAAGPGVEPLSVSTYTSHACAIRSGQAYCWGLNVHGQVVSPAGEDVLVPLPVSGAADAVDVATGTSQTCLARASGVTDCWGYALDGVVPVEGLSGAVDLAYAASAWCALRDTGEVRCWGDGHYGQLGDGTRDWRQDARPVPLPELAVEVYANYMAVCALGASGTVYCWGLAYGDTPAPQPDLSPATQVVVSGTYHSSSSIRVHACALGIDGGVRCQGDNTFGQLALPVGEAPTAAVPIEGAIGARSLDVGGGGETYAVLADGGVRCWGGSCGRTVVPIEGVDGVRELSVGNPSCAVFADDVVRCWGINEHGQLGDGTTQDRGSPTPILW